MGRNFRHLDNLFSNQNSASKIFFLFSLIRVFTNSNLQILYTHTHILPEQAQNAKYENNFFLENTEIYVGC